MTDARPLRGAALIAARNSRPSVAPEAQPALAPQATPSGDLRELLHHPEVAVTYDETQCAVAVLIPPHLAKPLANLAPDPVQFLLAVKLAEAAEQDAVEWRRDLLSDMEPRL